MIPEKRDFKLSFIFIFGINIIDKNIYQFMTQTPSASESERYPGKSLLTLSMQKKIDVLDANFNIIYYNINCLKPCPQ